LARRCKRTVVRRGAKPQRLAELWQEGSHVPPPAGDIFWNTERYPCTCPAFHLQAHRGSRWCYSDESTKFCVWQSVFARAVRRFREYQIMLSKVSGRYTRLSGVGPGRATSTAALALSLDDRLADAHIALTFSTTHKAHFALAEYCFAFAIFTMTKTRALR
jgi:hypothetical protein